MSIMVKAIKVKLRQQLANYRKPASFLIKESYPLPPYSSVIGMLHNACGFTSYHPVKVGIQGSHASDVADLAVLYNFGIKYDAGRHQAKVKNFDGGYDGINRGVRPIHLLTDIELTLYVVPEQEHDLDIMYQGLLRPQQYLSLGRHEDLVRIDSVEVVELVVYDGRKHDRLDIKPMYVPINQIKGEPRGTVYNLNKTFHIDPKKNLRLWDEVVLAGLVQSTPKLKNGAGWVDTTENSLVCLA
jgi:CRISPR-associated protein Cas5t